MSYDDKKDLRDLIAREAQEQREDREFELRRYEPNEGFGPVYRAPDEQYAHAKAVLEERMGLEGSHLSPARLRLLDEYNTDAERMG